MIVLCEDREDQHSSGVGYGFPTNGDFKGDGRGFGGEVEAHSDGDGISGEFFKTLAEHGHNL